LAVSVSKQKLFKNVKIVKKNENEKRRETVRQYLFLRRKSAPCSINDVLYGIEIDEEEFVVKDTRRA
jgi:hypothetical protein